MHASLFQLGRLHVPVSAVFFALGLIAALALSQWTARYTRLDPDVVWNAGVTAIVAAFVISRLLLIAFNLHSFLQYPLLLMAAPSLTSTGVLLTGLFMYAYLRWRRFALLPLLDACAPCIALLWAFVNLGYLVEGTHDGMPMYLRYGPGHQTVPPVHPVEVYTLAIAGVLCVLLFLSLRSRSDAGRTSGIGLLFAGVAIFIIDFFRLPSELVSNSWLDPAQIIGVLIFAAGGLIYEHRASRKSTERSEVTNAV